MYQTSGTIRDTVEEINGRSSVLPALKREFVLKPAQICKFFDSLVQGYPLGTFLYWQVSTDNTSMFKFYESMRNYHDRDNSHLRNYLEAGVLYGVFASDRSTSRRELYV